MEEILPDILLYLFRFVFGGCETFKNVAKLYFLRIFVQFGISLTELIFLEISATEQNTTRISDINARSAPEQAMRYSVIGSMSIFVAIAIWYFMHYVYRNDKDQPAVPHKKLMEMVCLFKVMEILIDSLFVAYTAVLYNDFEVALPFFAIPHGNVNLTAWIISLVTFIDILFGVVELIYTVYKLCKESSRIHPGDEKPPEIPDMNEIFT